MESQPKPSCEANSRQLKLQRGEMQHQNMNTSPEMRDLAARLIVYESYVGENSVSLESAALRVYNKLHQSISAFAGVAAFQSFAFRALSQVQSEVPRLWSVQIAEDGSLESIRDIKSQTDNGMDLAGEEGKILIGRLLNLLHIFLGEALTLSLLRDAWPVTAFDDRSSGNGRKS
jgi:hypothetical protein